MTLDADDINAIAEAVFRRLHKVETVKTAEPTIEELNEMWARDPELLKEYNRQNRTKRRSKHARL